MCNCRMTKCQYSSWREDSTMEAATMHSS
jgi:hypothetical protein